MEDIGSRFTTAWVLFLVLNLLGGLAATWLVPGAQLFGIEVAACMLLSVACVAALDTSWRPTSLYRVALAAVPGLAAFMVGVELERQSPFRGKLSWLTEAAQLDIALLTMVGVYFALTLIPPQIGEWRQRRRQQAG